MKKDSAQQKFWTSKSGEEYTDRNIFNPESLDKIYLEYYGITRTAMNDDFLRGLNIANILEVGCNMGSLLQLLQKQGFQNLVGIDTQNYAIELAEKNSSDIDYRVGSAFELPFTDSSFDLVFTSGVLIHISPKDVRDAMAEIYRVSKKYIWGFEYFSETHQEIEYRGHKDRLWKSNFAKLYREYFPDLVLVRERKFKYLSNDNIDQMFLFKKP